MTVLLETSRLIRRYGGVTAVDGVDFTLNEGELRCLIGPNGAGKSTFFKMLCGLVPPSSGAIKIRNDDVTGMRPHEIASRGVGIKTQVPSLFDGLTVRESVEVAAMRRLTPSAACDIADETLGHLNMKGIANRIVGQLSHGQRQWTELAMVLSTDPKIVLLDEPVAGMTHDEVNRTEDILKHINSTRTVIVVEHDMQFVKRIATKVTVFHHGRILIEDDVDRVLANSRVRDVYLGKSGLRYA